MALEPIRRRAFSEPDRADVQERAAHAVETGGDPLIQGEVDKGPGQPLSLDQVPVNQVQQALPRLNVQRQSFKSAHPALALKLGACETTSGAVLPPRAANIAQVGSSQSLIDRSRQ